MNDPTTKLRTDEPLFYDADAFKSLKPIAAKNVIILMDAHSPTDEYMYGWLMPMIRTAVTRSVPYAMENLGLGQLMPQPPRDSLYTEYDELEDYMMDAWAFMRRLYAPGWSRLGPRFDYGVKATGAALWATLDMKNPTRKNMRHALAYVMHVHPYAEQTKRDPGLPPVWMR